MKLYTLLGAFAALVLATGSASATTSKSTSFSGYELFLGFTRPIAATPFTCDGTSITTTRKTTGATFSGWTDTSIQWVSPIFSTGGLVTGSVNYVGAPGLGNTVCVTGGIWSWQLKSGKTFYGKIVDGYVQWPESGQSDDCGTDVGVFLADVSVATGGSGTIAGCLNDQNRLIPPKIWGTVDLTLP